MAVFDKTQSIEEHHHTVKTYKRRMENAKAAYDAEKKAYEAAIRRRDAIIEIGEDALREQQPLFDQAGSDHTNGAAKNGAAKERKPSKKDANEAAINAAAAPNEAWKSLPVSDAIKVGSVVNGLDTLDKPVRTLGELAAWLNEPGNRLTNLPGVGEEKMSKALDQFTEFWKAHPEYTR